MKKSLVALSAVLLMGSALCQPAGAQDATSPWQVRLRLLGVLPDSSGSTLTVQGVPGLSSPNAGLSIANSIVPELDISYFVTPNVAFEVILGVTPHGISGSGALANLNIGHAWLLPPTVMAQYHFTNFGAFKPYIGVGANYTFFFAQNPGNTPNNGLSVTTLNINNTFGAAAQIGFDYMINRNWGVNFDVKKLLLRPTYNATVNGTIAVSGQENIDPWLVGAGVTYRF